jgi:hypothetical protein
MGDGWVVLVGGTKPWIMAGPVIHGQSWSYPCRFGFLISNVMQRSNECMP